MTRTTIILAVALSLSAVTPAQYVDAGSDTIAVFVSHKRHSAIPAHIERMSLWTYTGRILASGAFPAWEPMELIKAGAVVVAQRAVWLKRHHDPRFTWRGERFDVFSGSAPRWCRGCDAGQYYRPAVYVHSRIRHAVSAVMGWHIRKHGRMTKPQWSSGGSWCGDERRGNRLPAGGGAACARAGHDWRSILRVYFAPMDLVRA